MNDDQLKKFYANIAKQFGLSSRSTMEDSYIRKAENEFFIDSIGELTAAASSTLTIVDLGCGNGHTLSLLSEKFPQHRYIGVEFTPELLELAQSRNLKNALFYSGDIRDLSPLAHFIAGADIVITQRSLINLLGKKQQVKALTQISCILCDGGSFLLSESFYDSWCNLNFAREEFGLEPLPMSPQNLYLTNSRLKILSKVGFEEVPHTMGTHYLSSHFYLSRVIHPQLMSESSKHISKHFLNFFNQALPSGIGEYSPIQLRWFKKSL